MTLKEERLKEMGETEKGIKAEAKEDGNKHQNEGKKYNKK